MSTLNTPKRSTFLSFLFLICLVSISAATAKAATYTVTNIADSGPGSLRQAIFDANSTADNDTIEFDLSGCPCVITLTSGELSIANNGGLTINGPGATQLSVSGNNTSRVFYIDFGAGLVINGLTVTGGNGVGSFGVSGGGIASRGSLTVTNSTISGNSSAALGGGIFSVRNLRLTNSTVSNNSANSGGGVASAYIARVTNSTFNNNSANFGAGGIYSTYHEGNGNLLILTNSIIANSTGPDCLSNGGWVHASNSLIEDGLSCVNGTNSNNLTGDPMLGPLQNNGGPTRTHALLPGSPAIDAGGPTDLTTDQRGGGFARVVGAAADMGAFEVQPTCSGIAFAPAVNFGVGAGPRSIVVGDFNGDGNLDLAAVLEEAGYVSVLLADGAGGFLDPAYFEAGNNPWSLTAGDFNGDGDLDLAVANLASDDVSVLLGDGTGGFLDATNFAVGSAPYSVAAADFNEDGYLDLAVANVASGDVSVLIGNGLGGFLAAENLEVGVSPSSVAAADFNADGHPDLAVANLSSNNVSVLIGNGAGGFLDAANFAVGVYPWSIATGDFNGDGKLDLAIANYGSLNTSVLIGNGLGAFAPAANFSVGGAPRSVATGDFNGDGVLDLAVANFGIGPANVSVLLGDGSGGFAAASALGVWDVPVSVAVEDFNRDGRLDLAAADAGDDAISILINNCGVNTAPVANEDSYWTIEEVPLNAAAPGILGNDTDGDNDTLAAVLVSGPSNGTLSISADGSFTYTPNVNFNGIDSFTYNANDGSADSNAATVTITVNPINDAPVVSVTPASQTVQYSDAISPVTISASDVETPAGSLLIGFTHRKDNGSVVAGLPSGMNFGGACGAGNVCGIANVPSGSYAITVSVTDTGDGSSPSRTSTVTFTVVVNREAAVAVPDLANSVSKQVDSPGGTASGVTGQICFDITELADGSAGNTALIDAATVTISPVGGGSGGSTIASSAVTFTSPGGVGEARTACVTLSLVNAPANVYEVVLTIRGNYYTGTGTTVFTVFDPSAGFASGGGWIINPNNGYRANYGIHMKYAKNGNVQGSVLYVEHRPDGDYKVKSTALAAKGAFAIIPITGGSEARMTGKATVGPEGASIGNHGFVVRMIDMGTPGTNDKLGLKVIDPAGQTLNIFTFDPILLGGGNNQVPRN